MANVEQLKENNNRIRKHIEELESSIMGNIDSKLKYANYLKGEHASKEDVISFLEREIQNQNTNDTGLFQIIHLLLDTIDMSLKEEQS